MIANLPLCDLHFCYEAVCKRQESLHKRRWTAGWAREDLANEKANDYTGLTLEWKEWADLNQQVCQVAPFRELHGPIISKLQVRERDGGYCMATLSEADLVTTQLLPQSQDPGRLVSHAPSFVRD